MPKSKKNKDGRLRTEQSRAALAAAAKDVQDGMSKRSASQKHGVDKTTLCRYLRSGSEPFGYENLRQKRQVFSDAMEENLADHIKNLCKMIYGVSKSRCQEIAYQFALQNNIDIPQNWTRDKKAGRDWYQGFRDRHNLSLRAPEATSLARATAFNRHSVSEFFKNLAEVLDKHKFSAADILNVDESGLHTVQRPANVLAPKGMKQVGAITSAERGQLVSVICTISATGNAIPPVYVFPRVRYNTNFIAGAPPGSIGCCSGNGWVNEDVFTTTYIPHLIKHTRCSPEHKILLILDNHVSHVSLKLIEMARENGIVLLTITPHTSHKLQPLDVSVFGPFKSLYNSAMDGWLRSNPGQTVKIYDIPAISATAFQNAMTPANITSGFLKTGIYPYNENVFMDHDFASSFVSDRDYPNNDVGQTPSSNDNDPSSPLAASTSYVSPSDIAPLPKKGARVLTNRKRKKSTVLTSSPHFKMLIKEKENKSSRPRPSQKPKAVKKKKVRRQIIAASDTDSGDEGGVVLDDDSSDVDEGDDFLVGDWVLVSYEGRNYPGEVTLVLESDVRVNVMRKAGKNWKWPETRDEIFYDKTQVTKRLPTPIVAGSRGQFSFEGI